MKRLLFSSFFILFFTILSKSEVKPHMQDFFSITYRMKPFLTNKSEYLNDKNSKEISTLLNEFNKKTQKLKLDQMAKTDDMKFRIQQLADGVGEAQKAFADGYKDYSFWAFKSTLSNCFACHTQKALPESNYKIDSGKSTDLYSEADFLFIVRDYSQAMPLFEKIVQEYPQNKIRVEDLENSLRRILYYTVRVQRDDKAAITLFNKLHENKSLPTSLSTALAAWKKYLENSKEHISQDISFAKPENLTAFIEAREKIADKYKSAQQRSIVDLETALQLFKELEKNPKDDLKPWLLYWLAKTENDYRLTMFDISTEIYLRECLEHYPQHSVASKCLAFYKDIKTDLFSGSRGLDLPKNISDEIKKYEKAIQKKSL